MKWKRPKGKTKLTGLGDLVATVAQPIAKAFDRLTGSDLQNCSGCAARKKDWNQKFPF